MEHAHQRTSFQKESPSFLSQFISYHRTLLAVCCPGSQRRSSHPEISRCPQVDIAEGQDRFEDDDFAAYAPVVV
jgi:hypothetical protein